MKKLLAVSLMLTTISCTMEKPYSDTVNNEVNKAKNKNENVFYDTLRLEYKGLADAAWANGHTASAKGYGRKAEMAVVGKTPSPSFPNQFTLSNETLNELKEAYKMLNKLGVDGAYKNNPKKFALAQTNYDCWLEFSEKDIEKSLAEKCKKSFSDNIADLKNSSGSASSEQLNTVTSPNENKLDLNINQQNQGVAVISSISNSNSLLNTGENQINQIAQDSQLNVAQNTQAIKAPNNAVRIQKLADMPAPFLAFFDYNSHEINAETIELLDNVVANYNDLKPDFIGLLGATDSSGSAAYNKKLAQKRVIAVAKYLVLNGIPEDKLKGRAAGEDLQRKETTDNTKEANNRFVAIAFKKIN